MSQDKLPDTKESDSAIYLIVSLVFVAAFLGAIFLLYHTTEQFNDVNTKLIKLENQTNKTNHDVQMLVNATLGQQRFNKDVVDWAKIIQGTVEKLNKTETKR